MTIDRISGTDLFVGNSNDARDIDNLRRLDIQSAVNVAKDLEAPWFHGNFRNYKVSLLDGPGNEVYHYRLAVHVVMELLSNGQKVLLHCHGGISRSPAIATLVLYFLGKAASIEEAGDLVSASRPVASIHPAHWEAMRKLVQSGWSYKR